jgi:hypothetical protein
LSERPQKSARKFSTLIFKKSEAQRPRPLKLDEGSTCFLYHQDDDEPMAKPVTIAQKLSCAMTASLALRRTPLRNFLATPQGSTNWPCHRAGTLKRYFLTGRPYIVITETSAKSGVTPELGVAAVVVGQSPLVRPVK